MTKIWLLRWIALLALALLGPLLGGVESSHAQGQGITVTTLEAVSEFPKGIRFRLEVESLSPITEAALRFTVSDQPVQRSYPLDIASPIARLQTEVLVRTDTYERYIPPGTDIRYFLEVKAQGGQALTTEPRQFTYLDARFEWKEEREGKVSVLSYGPGSSQAGTVLRTVTATLQDIGALLGVTLNRPLRLVMYNSVSDMLGALPLASEALTQQLITEGQAHTAAGVILLLASVGNVVGVASHEVTHVLMYDAANNSFHAIPTWLDEGMAEYGNREPASSGDYDRALASAIAQNRLIPFRQLAGRPGRAEDIILLYGQGKSFVDFLVETYRAEALRKMLALFKAGASLDSALQQAYGASLDELENRWRRSLGASLIAVSQPVVRPSPAPIPTLPPLTLGLSAPTPKATPPGSAVQGGGFTCRRAPGARGVLDLSLVLLGIGLAGRAVRGRR